MTIIFVSDVKKCMKQCPVGAIHVEDDGKVVVNPFKCISCGECLDVCPVNGAMKGVSLTISKIKKS